MTSSSGSRRGRSPGVSARSYRSAVSELPLLGASDTRAIRRLRPDPVPPALIRKVCEAGTFAPSGGNRQPWFFIAVTDPERRAFVAERYRTAFRTTSSRRVAAAEDPSYPEAKRRNLRAAMHLAEHLHEVPVLLFVAGWTRRGAPQLQALFPAIQNVLLACRAVGLGASLTTVHRAYGREIDDWLGLPENAPTCALLPIGWPRRTPWATGAAVGRHVPLRGALSGRRFPAIGRRFRRWRSSTSTPATAEARRAAAVRMRRAITAVVAAEVVAAREHHALGEARRRASSRDSRPRPRPARRATRRPRSARDLGGDRQRRRVVAAEPVGQVELEVGGARRSEESDQRDAAAQIFRKPVCEERHDVGAARVADEEDARRPPAFAVGAEHPRQVGARHRRACAWSRNRRAS